MTTPQPGFLRRLYCYLRACATRQRAVLPGPDYRSEAEKRIDESGSINTLEQVSMERPRVQIAHKW